MGKLFPLQQLFCYDLTWPLLDEFLMTMVKPDELVKLLQFRVWFHA